MSDVNNAELQALADAAAKKAIEELFVKLGVDLKDPLAVQMDFAHLRRQRQASEEVSKLAMRTVWGLVITGGIGLLITGIKLAIKTP